MCGMLCLLPLVRFRMAFKCKPLALVLSPCCQDSVHWDPQRLINIMLKLHPFFLQLVPVYVLGKQTNKQKEHTTMFFAAAYSCLFYQ